MINTKPTKFDSVADAPDIPRQADPGPVTTSLGASSAQVQCSNFSANPPNPVQPGAVRRRSSQEQALRALYEAAQNPVVRIPGPHGTEPPLAHAQTDSRRRKLALKNAPSAFESRKPDSYLEWPNDPNKVDDTSPNNPVIPVRQIRAIYNEHTIRVYQAYSHEIADSALAVGTFEPPSFKMNRMTWIKPSFLWTMYRSGWGMKDSGQSRILAIDITREGFEWAMNHSCPSHPDPSMSVEDWKTFKKESPVVVQWDPERDLLLQRLPHKTIQIGLSKEAVKLYTSQWICKITDVTSLAHEIHTLVADQRFEEATRKLPVELPYE
jgi:Domain of unknown function (DUF4291)